MKRQVCITICAIAIVLLGATLAVMGIRSGWGKQSETAQALKQPLPSIRPAITFTALKSDEQMNDWGADPISRAITERTGVSLNYLEYKYDATNIMKVMLASKTYPELLLSVNNDTVALYASAGALCPMDDYIDQYGQNIQAVFGADLSKMRYEGDGKIYGVNREYKGVTSETDALFNVQLAVLKEFKYPRLKTLEDLHQLLKAYKARYPQYEGQETIGVSGWADSYGFNITINNPALRAGGYQNDGQYVVADDLSVHYGFTTPAAKTYLKWLNQLYREGLFDDSALIQDRKSYAKKVQSGRVMVVPTEYWDLADLEASLRQEGKSDRCYAAFPLLSDADAPSNISNYDPMGAWKSVITKNCKDPVAAFRFFDEMWSEPMQVLCGWGVEGITYDNVNGKRTLRPEIYTMIKNDPKWRNKTGLQMYCFWCVGDNVKGKDGQYISAFGTRESLLREQDPAQKEALTAYGIDVWKDLCPPAKPSDWGFAWTLVLPDNSLGAAAETKVNDELRRKAIPRIVLAGSDDAFESEWKSFIREMGNSGIKAREEEIQNALKKRMTVWK